MENPALQRKLTLQKQMSMRTKEQMKPPEDLDEDPSKHFRKQKFTLYFEMAMRNLLLWVISYTGFIRMLASKEESNYTVEMPMFFSHQLELLAHTAPLMSIQMYNNYYMDKFQVPLDSMSVILSIINTLVLVLEVLFGQLLSTESDN